MKGSLTGLVLTAYVATLGAARPDARQSAVLRPLDATLPIGYFVSSGSADTGYRPSDRQLATWALEAWQRSSAGAIRFEPVPEVRALVRFYWADPTEGQYGEMQPLLIDGRRGAAVYIHPDMTSLGELIAQRAIGDPLLRDTVVYLTCLHESGHALGLSHTRDFNDVMYYFGYGGDVGVFFGRYRSKLRTRSDIGTTAGLSESDVRRIRALYPGRPGV